MLYSAPTCSLLQVQYIHHSWSTDFFVSSLIHSFIHLFSTHSLTYAFHEWLLTFTYFTCRTTLVKSRHLWSIPSSKGQTLNQNYLNNYVMAINAKPKYGPLSINLIMVVTPLPLKKWFSLPEILFHLLKNNHVTFKCSDVQLPVTSKSEFIVLSFVSSKAILINPCIVVITAYFNFLGRWLDILQFTQEF